MVLRHCWHHYSTLFPIQTLSELFHRDSLLLCQVRFVYDWFYVSFILSLCRIRCSSSATNHAWLCSASTKSRACSGPLYPVFICQPDGLWNGWDILSYTLPFHPWSFSYATASWRSTYAGLASAAATLLDATSPSSLAAFVFATSCTAYSTITRTVA